MSRGPRGRARLSVVGDEPQAGGVPEVAALREQLRAAGAPPEILDIVGNSPDLGVALERLESAGLAPSPEEALAVMLDGWHPLLRRGADALSAELTGVEFLAALRSTIPHGASLADVLGPLLTSAESSGGPEALAMLRVLAVIGDADTRRAATAGADRMVARRLKDRPWVRGLGSPSVGQAFGYSDPLGMQESVVVEFQYGRRSHIAAVLIDHNLGGGVKDCFFGDDPPQARSEYRLVARMSGAMIRDIPIPEAAEILERALAAEPCPVEPDQIEDVDSYLDLVRQRVSLLRAASRPARRKTRTVHRLKITLVGSKPPIWRRLEASSTTTLEQLHLDIQATFGWAGYHMWSFFTGHADFGIPDPELGFDDAATMTLSRVAPSSGDRLRYTYDFGDGWEHALVVEAVTAAEPDVSYPRCLTGRRACPPEDSGGMWGYADLLDILADPEHPEHTERLEWLGLESADRFDPAAFDLGEVNAALARRTRS
ncbi:MAG: plasmid pRiA4b ORF-3 family protein [Pseudonocardia sp.]